METHGSTNRPDPVLNYHLSPWRSQSLSGSLNLLTGSETLKIHRRLFYDGNHPFRPIKLQSAPSTVYFRPPHEFLRRLPVPPLSTFIFPQQILDSQSDIGNISVRIVTYSLKQQYIVIVFCVFQVIFFYRHIKFCLDRCK